MAVVATGDAGSTWSVVAHLDGRGGLCEAAQRYAEQLTAVRGKLANLAIQMVREAPDGTANVVRWKVAAGGGHSGLSRPEPLPVGASTAESLRTFLEWAGPGTGEGPVLFLYLGHGVGLTAEQGRDGVPGIRALRQALEAEVGQSGKLYEIVALDTCFGASLETAYELRGVARYLTAAPGLMDSPGLNWREAFERDGSAGAGGLSLARAVVRGGMVGGRLGRRALVGMDLRRTEEAAATASRLVAALRDDMGRCGPVVALVRSRTLDWGERDELCDMGQWAAGMAANGPTSLVREAAEATAQALDAMVIARWMGRGLDTENMAHPPSGVGVFFPPSLEEVPTSYNGQLGFARTAGWATFLTEYWDWARSELLGTIRETGAVG